MLLSGQPECVLGISGLNYSANVELTCSCLTYLEFSIYNSFDVTLDI
jgi:hypothetical protein